MRNSQSVVDTRRKKILDLLDETGFVKISDLAKRLNVSPLTIRRDLEALDDHDMIERFYGGAALVQRSADSNIFSSAYTLHKQAIAQKAATLVQDGDTIFINTSSTALAILPYINAKQVTVITNNMRATACKRREDMILMLTGGELRLPKEAMVGDFATNNLSTVTANKCFLGCNGITTQEGLTTAVFQEAAVNRLMLTRVTGPRYVLADKSKIGRQLNFIYGPLDEVTCLITDTEAPQDEIEKLRQTMEVIQVPPLKKLSQAIPS